MKPAQLFMFLFVLISLQHGTSLSTHRYFTGEVTYSYNYATDSLNVDTLISIKPYKSIFRFDMNNYQSRFIGKDTFTYYYSGILNRSLSETNSDKNYECEDYGIPNDSILSFKVYDTDERILGHRCRIVEYQTKNFWNQYYVATDLVIAPNTYRNHLAYNWSYYGEKSGGGLILKLEHRFKKYTMKGVVTSINKTEEGFNALQLDTILFKKYCN